MILAAEAGDFLDESSAGGDCRPSRSRSPSPATRSRRTQARSGHAPMPAAADGATEAGASAGTIQVICQMERLEQFNAGMLFVTLPRILEADSQPGRWCLVVSAQAAFMLASGACLGRLSDTSNRPPLLMRAVVLSSAASFLICAGCKLQSVKLMIGGAILGRVR
jgi:hypothetical protein